MKGKKEARDGASADRVLLEALLDGSREIIFLIDTRFIIERVNAFALTFLGYLPEELVSRPMDKAFGEEGEGRARLEAAAASISEGADLRAGDYSLMTRNGKCAMARLALRRLEDGRGGTRGYMLSGHPVLAAGGNGRAARHGLAERVLRGVTSAVLVVDPFTREVLDCNEGAEALFRYSRRELLGSSTQKLYASPEVFHEMGRVYTAAYASSGVHQDDIEFRRKDGVPLRCETILIGLFDGSDRLDKAIVILRDRELELKRERELVQLISKVSGLSEELCRVAASYSPGEGGATLSSMGFTLRQVEIARLLASGAATKEIAFQLRVAESTIKNQLAKMYAKLGVQSRVEFVRRIAERSVALT
jgi:PAS domain S-box-containing protein